MALSLPISALDTRTVVDKLSRSGGGSGSAGSALKKFMPNIIMVDFVDKMKGTEVYDLNNFTASEVSTRIEDMEDSKEEI